MVNLRTHPQNPGTGAMTLGREEVAPMDTDHGKLGFQERARQVPNLMAGMTKRNPAVGHLP